MDVSGRCRMTKPSARANLDCRSSSSRRCAPSASNCANIRSAAPGTMRLNSSSAAGGGSGPLQPAETIWRCWTVGLCCCGCWFGTGRLCLGFFTVADLLKAALQISTNALPIATDGIRRFSLGVAYKRADGAKRTHLGKPMRKAGQHGTGCCGSSKKAAGVAVSGHKLKALWLGWWYADQRYIAFFVPKIKCYFSNLAPLGQKNSSNKSRPIPAIHSRLFRVHPMFPPGEMVIPPGLCHPSITP